MDEHNPMRHFLVFVFILLIPCFVLWTVFNAAIAMPAIGLVHFALTHWFPDVVNALYVDGSHAVLMTEFGEKDGKLVPLLDAEYRLGFKVNPGIVSYSLPFYTALHFATTRKEYMASYMWGIFILYPLFMFGLVCLCLRELLVNVGADFFNQPGVFVPNAELIGILYQFNVLIVPTLAPAVLWLWQSKDTTLLQYTLGKTRIS